ncbi:hypothetical protein MES5069_110053 [Mesorhizobium escarrei]|uniref:Uncharacterized protein n=1 Tax=Mesorhizobium escarrei TaxID=666018 RepID=A0ABM9DGD5_9HYPH|nr:hypothetical protein MES5069_110053 [Mesorhizobium escarrei]
MIASIMLSPRHMLITDVDARADAGAFKVY